MSKKLFVGGLSWGTDDEGLRLAFERYGQITEAKVITDRETGRSRGFGFVTFAADSDASSAMEMDGKELDGRTLKVNEAQERAPRGGGGGGGGGGYGGGGGGYGGGGGSGGGYGGGGGSGGGGYGGGGGRGGSGGGRGGDRGGGGGNRW